MKTSFMDKLYQVLVSIMSVILFIFFGLGPLIFVICTVSIIVPVLIIYQFFDNWLYERKHMKIK